MMALPDDIQRLLDLRGLKCPLPAMKTRNAVMRMEPGGSLIVLATDPMSAIDVPHAVAQAGGSLVSQSRDADVLRFEIVKRDHQDASGEQAAR